MPKLPIDPKVTPSRKAEAYNLCHLLFKFSCRFHPAPPPPSTRSWLARAKWCSSFLYSLQSGNLWISWANLLRVIHKGAHIGKEREHKQQRQRHKSLCPETMQACNFVALYGYLSFMQNQLGSSVELYYLKIWRPVFYGTQMAPTRISSDFWKVEICFRVTTQFQPPKWDPKFLCTIPDRFQRQIF